MYWGALLLPLLTTLKLQDPFTVIKWHWVQGLAVLACFYPVKYLTVPSWKMLPKLVRTGLIMMGLTSLYTILALRGDAFVGPLLDRLSFLALVLALYQGMMRIEQANLISVVLVILYLWCQMLGLDFLDLTFGSRPNSFFGNPNMLAQFLGLSFFVQVHNTENKWRDITLGVIAATIYYMGCRSVFLGVVLGVPFLHWSKKSALSTALTTLIFIGAYSAFPHLTVGKKQMQESTQVQGADGNGSTWEIRKTLWTSALSVWKDHPMGVGAGGFEFSDTPYRVGTNTPNAEFLTYNTPHNEFVRYLVEEGPVYVVGALFFLLPLIRRERLMWGMTAFIFVECFFQFPFMNAASFFYLAFWVSRLLYQGATFVTPPRWRYLLGLLLLVLFVRVSYTSYLISNKHNLPQEMELACRLNPASWRACIYKAITLMTVDKYKQADDAYQYLHHHYPHMYPALRHEAINHFKLNNTHDGCFALWKFDILLGGKHSLRQVYELYCLQYERYFKESYASTWK